MIALEEQYRRADSPRDFARAYLTYLSSILEQLDVDMIARIIAALTAAALRGSTVYVLGNGGSAATASHLANDLMIGAYTPGHPPLRIIALTDNVPVMTAVANDADYAHIFTDQLRSLLRPDDVVIALSVSGNSPNVLAAVRYAKDLGAVTIGCAGFSGGALKELAAYYLHVPSFAGEYGPVEDAMLIVCHTIHSYFVLARRGRLRRTERQEEPAR